MNKKYIYECLLNIIDKEDIKLDEPMKKHISFKRSNYTSNVAGKLTGEAIPKCAKAPSPEI